MHLPETHIDFNHFLIDQSINQSILILGVTTRDGSAKQATDYDQLDERIINFIPEQSVATFVIIINNDNVNEMPESFHLELSLPTNGATVIPYKAEVTIIDGTPGCKDHIYIICFIGVTC